MTPCELAPRKLLAGICGKTGTQAQPADRPEWHALWVPTTRYPPIDESIVRSLSEVLGRTEGGLTNKQIDQLLRTAGVPDPTPEPPRGSYVTISKRDRLYNALSTKQRLDGCANSVLAFVAKALAPVLTDTLDGDDGAIGDGDLGGERPNDQRGCWRVGNGGNEGGGSRRAAVVRRVL